MLAAIKTMVWILNTQFHAVFPAFAVEHDAQGLSCLVSRVSPFSAPLIYELTPVRRKKILTRRSSLGGGIQP